MRQRFSPDGIVFDLGVSSMQLDEAGTRLLVPGRRAARHAHGARRRRAVGRRGAVGGRGRQYSVRSAARRHSVPARRGTPVARDRGGDRAAPRRTSRSSARRSWPTLVASVPGHASSRRQASGDADVPGAAHLGQRRARRDRARTGRGRALLAPGGRLVVVTFHSLEDRIVKRFLADRAGRSRRRVAAVPDERRTSEHPSFRFVNSKSLSPGEAGDRRQSAGPLGPVARGGTDGGGAWGERRCRARAAGGARPPMTQRTEATPHAHCRHHLRQRSDAGLGLCALFGKHRRPGGWRRRCRPPSANASGSKATSPC